MPSKNKPTQAPKSPSSFGKNVFLALLVLIAATFPTWRPVLQDYAALLGIGQEQQILNVEKCKLIPGPVGCEDIAIQHKTGQAFMACTNLENRHTYFPPLAHFGEPSNENDPAFVYDIKSESLQRLTLNNFKGELRTHGLSIWENPTDSSLIYLFFVNHRRGGSVIEIFTHTLGTTVLDHVETAAHPLIRTPNNLVPIGPRTFYTSNDHRHRKGFWRVIEEFGRMPWGNVVLWDKGEAQVVADGIRSANGMASSPDAKYIYVNAVVGTETLVYERQQNNSLLLIDRVKIGFLDDNVDVESNSGDLYITGHTHLIKFLQHAKDPVGSRSPSKVVRAYRGEGKQWKVEPILIDDGKLLNGATISAVDAATNTTLIGGVYMNGVASCKGLVR